MSKDEFTQLFKHMKRVESKLDLQLENMATKEDIRQIISRLDSIEKDLEISDAERLVMGHHLDRVDRWAHELADKINYKLTV